MIVIVTIFFWLILIRNFYGGDCPNLVFCIFCITK